MKIVIDNVAKISHADIEVNGITVISGKNSTGKTTIGKSIFAIFNSLFDNENKIKQARKSRLFRYVLNSVNNNFHNNNDFDSNENFSWWELARSITSKLIDENLNNNIDAQLIKDIVNDFLTEKDVTDCEGLLSKLAQDIVEDVNKVNSIDSTQLLKEIVERYFDRVFYGQINSLTNDNLSSILIQIKDKTTTAIFENNKCIEINDAINILHEAFYIDNPFVLDKLPSYTIRQYSADTLQNKQLLSSLSKNNEDILDGLFDAVSAKEKLDEIYSVLDETVPGSFSINEKGVNIILPGYKNPIAIQNLSTGIKSFALIKLLLERGALKEKDVLILDEPEIHLHPEWLISYAKIIVILQKQFNLSLIITTHSSHFLQAIEYYSEYYGINKNCKYYLSSINENSCFFEDVTDNIEKIYREMVEPSILIDDLKYQLEENEND